MAHEIDLTMFLTGCFHNRGSGSKNKRKEAVVTIGAMDSGNRKDKVVKEKLGDLTEGRSRSIENKCDRREFFNLPPLPFASLPG